MKLSIMEGRERFIEGCEQGSMKLSFAEGKERLQGCEVSSVAKPSFIGRM